MANSDDNNSDEYQSKKSNNGSYSSRSQTSKSKSILKNSYNKKLDVSDDEDEQEYKSGRLDDLKRYGSPINSSRSIANKPPTGRLQPLSNNRDSYETSSNKKLSPLNDRKPFSGRKAKYDAISDDEDNNNNNNNYNKGKFNRKSSDSDENSKKFNNNKKNSDSDEMKEHKQKFNAKKFNDDDNNYDDLKNRFSKSKNLLRNLDDNYVNNDFEKNKKFDSDDESPKRSFKNTKNDSDADIIDTKKSYTKNDFDKNKLGTSSNNNNNKYQNGSLSNRNNYYEEFDSYKNSNSKISSLKKKIDTDDDELPSRKLTDSLRLENEVTKEYEKLYNSSRDDDFKAFRNSNDKSNIKNSLKNNELSSYNRSSLSSPLGKASSLSNDKNSLSLHNNRATSLDRVNTNSAYNTPLNSNNKFNSSNNLNHLETMSEKSTGSFNNSNLSIREAKSRSFLVGSLSSAGGKGLLGNEELERHLIDKKARVLIVTYNMAEMKTMPEKLEELVLPDNIQMMPDIYAIGCQEFVLNQKEWEIKLQEIIGPSHVKLSSFYHGSIGLNIFIKRDLIWFCSVVDTEAINLRNVKMPIRTKASIILSFQFFGTLMCFICSHFESGDDKIDLRIENYKTTVSNITLPKSIEIKNRQENKKSEGDEIVDQTNKFDCVFWFGDLNFRSKKDREKVENKVSHLKSIKSNNYEELLNHDELYQILHNVYNPVSNKAFMNFIEPRIMFEPTYKYDLNSDNFDTSELCRIPSYTDRILYKSKNKYTISCSHYDSVKDIKSSDHRPVYALLEVTIRPGVDKVPLSFGNFDREVFIAGYKKRQMYRALDIGFTSNKVDVKGKSKLLRCPIQ